MHLSSVGKYFAENEAEDQNVEEHCEGDEDVEGCGLQPSVLPLLPTHTENAAQDGDSQQNGSTFRMHSPMPAHSSSAGTMTR